MLLTIINECFCSQLVFIHWLQNHLIPCPFKHITGIDCPGCGFQRSVLSLVQGDIHKSFILYPATIPLLLFFTYGLADRLFELDTTKNSIKKTFFLIIGAIIISSYIMKIHALYNPYKASA